MMYFFVCKLMTDPLLRINRELLASVGNIETVRRTSQRYNFKHTGAHVFLRLTDTVRQSHTIAHPDLCDLL